MLKLINRQTGGEMWVHASRLDEYLAAGHRLAAPPPPPPKEPAPEPAQKEPAPEPEEEEAAPEPAQKKKSTKAR